MPLTPRRSYLQLSNLSKGLIVTRVVRSSQYHFLSHMTRTILKAEFFHLWRKILFSSETFIHFTTESSPTSSEGYRKPTWGNKKTLHINEEEIKQIQQKKETGKSWPPEFSPEVQNYNFYYFCWLAPAGGLALDPHVPLPHGLLETKLIS